MSSGHRLEGIGGYGEPRRDDDANRDWIPEQHNGRLCQWGEIHASTRLDEALTLGEKAKGVKASAGTVTRQLEASARAAMLE
jgi:hypothetical protein